MAVEIPVVIDIEQAFKDAAAKVPNAMKPLQQSIAQLQEDLAVYRDYMKSVPVSSKEFEEAAKDIRETEEALDLLNSKVSDFVNRSGSVKQLSGSLAVIQQQFERMGSAQMFDASGKLSADAKKLQQDYATVATELDRVRSILTAEYEAQKRNTEEAERQKKAAQEHQQALTMTANSMSDLNTKLAAWQQELNTADVGSAKWTNAAAAIVRVSEKMQKVREELKKIQTETGSIDRLNAELQRLNRQWNAMGSADKFIPGTDKLTAEAQQIVRAYRAATAELEKQGKSLSKIIQEQKQIEQGIQNAISKRKYEDLVLKSTANTMGRLSEQARILSERLNNARFGTKRYDELKTKLEEVRAKMQQMQGSVSNTTLAMGKQSVVLQNLTSMASMYISVFGALRFVKQIRDVTAELEFQRISLGRLIQDEEYGAYLFERIKEAAIESPFRIKDLVTYTKQLAAYKIEQESLFDTTKRLADISAGLGVDMNRLILAYGQVRAASVLRGQELRQFTEAGIPLVELLAEKMGELNKTSYSTADVFKLISARAVPFSAIADIFEDLTEKGGMFYEMQAEQAKTLKGRWEKLKDTFDIALQSIGESKGLLSFKTYNDIILNSLNLLAKGIRVIPKVLEGATLAWIAYSVAISRSKKALRDEAIATAANTAGKTALIQAQKMGIKNAHAYAAAMTRASVASTGLGRALWKLWAAMVANPWAAGVAAVLGLVTAFASFRKNTDKNTASIVDFKRSVEDIAKSEKKYARTSGLIELYGELSSKTNRTEEENRKLYNTMQRLNDLFPDIKLGIDGENESLDENIRLLSEKNDAEIAASRKDAEESLRAAELNREQQQKILEQQVKDRAEAYDKMVEIRETRNIDYAPVAKKEYEVALEEFNKLDEAVQNTRDTISSLDESIEKLYNYLHPVTNELDGWKKEVSDLNSYKNSLGNMQIFTPAEIDGMEDVYDLWKKLKKIWTEDKTTIEGLESAYASAADTMAKASLFIQLEDARKKFSAVESMREFFGFDFTKKNGGSGYKQDPFISLMQNRIKFMQDFKRGYDDLSKYMVKSSALAKESGIMLGRGMSLGMSAEEQNRAAEDLLGWYHDARKKVEDELRKRGIKGASTTEILGIDTSKKSKAIQDLQKLLQQIWDAETDYDLSRQKKAIEDALKKLSDEIKRSETARNFYQDILGLTGDEHLAASMSVSVYGGIGDEFKDRMQKQLEGALESLKVDKNFTVTDDIEKAFSDMDFKKILAIEGLPEEVEKVVRQAYENSQKYDSDLLKNFAGLISKYGDTAQKVATIRAKAENEINRVKEALKLSLENTKLTPEEKKALQERADEIIKALEGQRDLDEFKAGEDYVKFFSEINVMTAEQAAEVRGKLRDAYLKAFHDGAISADELRRNLRAVDEQFKKLSESTTLLGSYLSGGFDAANAKLQEYADNVGVLAEKMKSGKELDQAEQSFASRMLKMFGGAEVKNAKSYEDLIKAFSSSGGLKEAGSAFGQMGKGMSAMAAKGPGALAIVDAIFQAVHSTITSIQQMIDELNRMRSEENKVGDWFKYVSDFDKYTYSGWEKLKSGDVIGATADAVSSWISIFNNIQEDKVKKINDDIEAQEKLVEELQYSYERLEKAIQNSFGSEYIYNFQKQLENLQAQVVAYRKQAELERGKGKSAEEDVAKDYEKQARDIEDRIEDMRSQLSEFFAGTNLTSAAEEFASAWIDAYKEFGSTTDAMSEKFNDMIESMINRSLAAKIMQEMLQPIFDQIDTLASDGLLSTEEIASIAELAQSRIPLINDAMTNLMTSLASAGLDVRTSTAGLHGISKDIAGASEESILSLAAAINTQNFYISYVPTISENVSQILAAMTGGVSPTAPVETTETGEVLPSVQRMVFNHLPNMDTNLSEVLRLFRSVITTKNSKNYIAVN